MTYLATLKKCFKNSSLRIHGAEDFHDLNTSSAFKDTSLVKMFMKIRSIVLREVVNRQTNKQTHGQIERQTPGKTCV